MQTSVLLHSISTDELHKEGPGTVCSFSKSPYRSYTSILSCVLETSLHAFLFIFACRWLEEVCVCASVRAGEQSGVNLKTLCPRVGLENVL